jgi:predicted ferric reductase
MSVIMFSVTSVASQVATHATKSWPWYIVRASGLASVLLLTLLVISGIGQVTGYTYRIFEPVVAWAVHRALGIALIFTVLAHIIFIIFDKYVIFTIPQILVPFLSTNSAPVTIAGVQLGSLFVTFGILSLYLLAFVTATSLLVIDRAKRLWRITHYLSYITIVLIFFHALFTGTDLNHGILRWAWIGAGVLLLVAIAMRLIRARTLKAEPSTEIAPH